MAEARQVSTANIVLPLASAIALALASYKSGADAGRTQKAIEGLTDQVSALRQEAAPIAGKMIEVQSRLAAVERDLGRLETRHNLLQDYTEGRISYMPYRRK